MMHNEAAAHVPRFPLTHTWQFYAAGSVGKRWIVASASPQLSTAAHLATAWRRMPPLREATSYNRGAASQKGGAGSVHLCCFRDNVPPRSEHPANAGGSVLHVVLGGRPGCRVPDALVQRIFDHLLLAMTGGTLTQQRATDTAAAAPAALPQGLCAAFRRGKPRLSLWLARESQPDEHRALDHRVRLLVEQLLLTWNTEVQAGGRPSPPLLQQQQPGASDDPDSVPTPACVQHGVHFVWSFHAKIASKSSKKPSSKQRRQSPRKNRAVT